MYSDKIENLIRQLYAPDSETRLQAMRDLRIAKDKAEFFFPSATDDVNSHIHTTYSFSPYTPAAAVFKSMEAGLATSGIMDHDSVGGAREFTEAGKIMGLPTTQGCEIRVSLKDTFLENTRVNNPDQKGVAYLAFHGIPDSALEATDAFLEPLRKARLQRNMTMVERLNGIISKPELHIDFNQDVMNASLFTAGGEITERHLLYALAKKLIEFKGKGPELTRFVNEQLGLPLSGKIKEQLDDAENPHYAYDLLGLFKGYYVSAFYVDATDECPPIREAVDFANKHGIIVAYPYLGDVTASVTGDKAAQTFEDEFLDKLFPFLQGLGFKALTYMPSRNTPAQIDRLMQLCEEYNFFQISGEDINQPRQKFICEAMREPKFLHLTDAAWALIGHERAASKDLSKGMFSPETMAETPALHDRILKFRQYALSEKAAAEQEAYKTKE